VEKADFPLILHNISRFSGKRGDNLIVAVDPMHEACICQVFYAQNHSNATSSLEAVTVVSGA
jgi:hypothetical protein